MRILAGLRTWRVNGVQVHELARIVIVSDSLEQRRALAPALIAPPQPHQRTCTAVSTHEVRRRLNAAAVPRIC